MLVLLFFKRYFRILLFLAAVAANLPTYKIPKNTILNDQHLNVQDCVVRKSVAMSLLSREDAKVAEALRGTCSQLTLAACGFCGPVLLTRFASGRSSVQSSQRLRGLRLGRAQAGVGLTGRLIVIYSFNRFDRPTTSTWLLSTRGLGPRVIHSVQTLIYENV